jgi:hypothetical protein
MKKFTIILAALGLILAACTPKPTETPTPTAQPTNGEAFELYLVADEQMSGADVYNQDINELPLADAPLITTADIASYDQSFHAINLTDEAYQRMLAVFAGGMPMSGVPFVIVSNGERIYAGAFWSMASSLSFDGIAIIEPLDPVNSPLYITLGYPGPDFYTGQDPRDNASLMQALDEAGVLK